MMTCVYPRREEKNLSVRSTLQILQQNLHWRDEADTESQSGGAQTGSEKRKPEDGIAVHVHDSHHAIDWDGATVKGSVTGYRKRRTTEAISTSELAWRP